METQYRIQAQKQVSGKYRYRIQKFVPRHRALGIGWWIEDKWVIVEVDDERIFFNLGEARGALSRIKFEHESWETVTTEGGDEA